MSRVHLLHVAAELCVDKVAFLAPVLRELAACGVEQTLLHAGPAGALPACEGVRRIALGEEARLEGWQHLRSLREALRAELDSHDYQAVHLHGAGAAWAAHPVLETRARCVPLFYSPHGPSGAYGARALADAVVLLAGRMRTASAPQAVSCCAAEARRLAALGGRAPTLLCPPVDARLFALVRRCGTPPTVLGIGDAGAWRAPEQFAELAARFHFAGEPARFLWAGAGGAQHERLLRAAGVTLSGWQAAHGAGDALATAAAVVLPGQSAGAPVMLAQAMAAGAPLAAMDLPGHRQLVCHEATALLASDLGSLALAVKALIDDRPRAEALGAQARAEARRRFPPERLRRALLELYRLVPVAQAVPASP